MKQSIYIDILIVLNIFVNYFLLLETAFMSNEKIKRLRLLLGSVLGGIYSLILILPPMNAFLSVLIKIVLSITIILVAFKIKNIKHFLRMFAVFFAVNFIFAGLMFAVWIVLKPNGMQFNNGAVYFEINALMLIGLTVFCYSVVSIISKLSKKSAPENKIVEIIVSFEKSHVCGKALIDTGNSLRDTFSNLPVVVVEFDFIKNILPDSIIEFFKKSDCLDTDYIGEEYKGKIRLIPFNSIGGDGLLKAFKSDCVTIIYDHKKLKGKNVYIAVKDMLLSNGEYVAIINPEMIDDFEKENLAA